MLASLEQVDEKVKIFRQIDPLSGMHVGPNNEIALPSCALSPSDCRWEGQDDRGRE